MKFGGLVTLTNRLNAPLNIWSNYYLSSREAKKNSFLSMMIIEIFNANWTLVGWN